MSEPTSKPYEVPKGVECPRCKQVIEFGQAVTPGAANVFRKGLIMVCSSCALVCIVGDSKLVPMAIAQIKALPQVQQRQLMAVCNRIAAEAVKKN